MGFIIFPYAYAMYINYIQPTIVSCPCPVFLPRTVSLLLSLLSFFQDFVSSYEENM